MPGCGREGALGDTCNDDHDCGEGLTCLDNFCAFGSRDKKKSKDDGDAPRFYFDVGVGMGLAYVSDGMRADSAPTASMLTDAATQTGGNPAMMQELLKDEGWDCNVQSANGSLSARDCKVMVGAPGFVAMPVINAAIGYYVTPRLGLAGILRYQIGHGEGSIGLSGGLRADILLSQPSATGFHAGLLAGVLLGSIQAQPPKKPTATTDGPYATSGVFGLQAGLRIGYRFTRTFGLHVTPAANMMLGDFMFALDATAGITISH
jgi:hypothetical protein